MVTQSYTLHTQITFLHSMHIYTTCKREMDTDHSTNCILGEQIFYQQSCYTVDSSKANHNTTG
jgi:hypothetical protein